MNASIELIRRSEHADIIYNHAACGVRARVGQVLHIDSENPLVEFPRPFGVNGIKAALRAVNVMRVRRRSYVQVEV